MQSREQLTIDTDSRLVAGRIAPVRDWEIVRWVGRIGAVTLAQIRSRFALGRTVAYRRVAACIEGALLERVELLRGQPALLRATARGLRLTGLPLAVAKAPPELVGHWIACGGVALALEREFGAETVSSDREIRLAERWAGEPIASAKLGEAPDGSPRLHLPDLAIQTDTQTIAVEVELTPKAPKRLEAIVKAWRRARWVDGVRYYASEGSTRAGLERAIASMRASARVEVRAVEPMLEPGARAERELGRGRE